MVPKMVMMQQDIFRTAGAASAVKKGTKSRAEEEGETVSHRGTEKAGEMVAVVKRRRPVVGR